ncbi:YDG/SRA domain-containing protein [Colletotrichum acutatum]
MMMTGSAGVLETSENPLTGIFPSYTGYSSQAGHPDPSFRARLLAQDTSSREGWRPSRRFARRKIRKTLSPLHFARAHEVGDDYLGDLLADLGDPGSVASTGPEQSIDFHTSFEGMPPPRSPNALVGQGLGLTALPEIGQADNFRNDSGFQGGNANAAPPLTYGPAPGHVAMGMFDTIKHSSSSPTATLLTATLLDKTWRT